MLTIKLDNFIFRTLIIKKGWIMDCINNQIKALIEFLKKKDDDIAIKAISVLVCLFAIEVAGAIILLSVDIFKRIF